MFGKRTKTPSEIIEQYAGGTGRRFELDDYVHGVRSDEERKNVVNPLMEINREFSTVEFPAGIDNPSAKPALKELVDLLRSKGM